MSEEQKFKPGDNVQLKGGGPKMSVMGYDNNGDVVCAWLDQHRAAHREAHPAASLKPYKRGPSMTYGAFRNPR